MQAARKSPVKEQRLKLQESEGIPSTVRLVKMTRESVWSMCGGTHC